MISWTWYCFYVFPRFEFFATKKNRRSKKDQGGAISGCLTDACGLRRSGNRPRVVCLASTMAGLAWPRMAPWSLVSRLESEKRWYLLMRVCREEVASAFGRNAPFRCNDICRRFVFGKVCAGRERPISQSIRQARQTRPLLPPSMLFPWAVYTFQFFLSALL